MSKIVSRSSAAKKYKKKHFKEMATCYHDSECKNAGKWDKCIECERNWDNWPEYNDNFELKDSSY